MYNLLVIDDDFVICKVLVRMLEAEKYRVRTRHTAGEGLTACLEAPPDLMLLDINLPDGSGLDLCRRMKEDPRIKHIPVIILTGGVAAAEDRPAALESGAQGYACKPFIMEELIARVGGLIARSGNRKGVQPV